MDTPLVPQTTAASARISSKRVIFKHVLRKNIKIMLRDKAALRRETLITVGYFALLILLSKTSGPPPLVPGHTVNPLMSQGSTLSTVQFDYSNSGGGLITQYQEGRTTIAVAPCDATTPSITSAVYSDLKTNYPKLGLSVDSESPLSWICLPTQQDILDRAKLHHDLLAGIVFDNDQPTLFSMHVNETLMPFSAGGTNFSHTGGMPVNNTAPDWLASGLVALQHSIQLSVIRVASAAGTNGATLVQDVSFRQEPFLPYPGVVYFQVGSIAPMYYIIIMAITSQSWIKMVLVEKEKQLRERLLVSGLPLWMLAITWATTFLLKGSVFMVVATVVGKILIAKTDVTIIFLLVALFVVSIVAMVLAFSALFKTAKVGASTYTFAVMIPGVLFNYVTDVNVTLKGFLYLFSPIGFVSSFQQLFAADQFDHQGVHWSNINSFGSGSNSSSLTVSFGMLMLVVDTVLYLSLAIYLNQIIPGNGGTTKTCCYCLKRCGKSNISPSNGGKYSGVDEENPVHYNNDVVQPADEIATGHGVGVSIKNLQKHFPPLVSGGEKIKAVDGLSLDMYDGQVTSLLGHNGAGKTTTMSLLTGMLDVTGGDADIYGLSLSHDLEKIRTMVGICTQHNLLWDELTVLEHLQLFGAIRGTSERDIDAKATELARQVGLGEKIGAYSKSLSGGMKRKLSVALALIGNPKVVFLDEPTAGMDPESRHELWNLITAMKTGRTVVLTTHHMDEADLLGDRIAIMAHGKLQVCGTSMWLKRKFGVGYNLSVDTLHASKVLSMVQSHIPDVVCNETTSQGLSCSLKLSHQSLFPNMLDAIDAMAEVQHYGMEMPTLEEVFIRLAVAGDQADGGAKRRLTNSSIASYNSGQFDEIKVDNEEKSGERHRLPAPGPMHPTWSGQTKTMLGKRVLIGKRNPYVMMQQILIPVLFMLPVFIVKHVWSQMPSNTNVASIAINAKIQLYDNNQQIADSDFPFWLYGSSEKNGTGTDVMRHLPIPGLSNTDKQPFAKVVEENGAMSPYTFNNMMLGKGNCFAGIQTTTATDEATGNTYVTANVTFNSTFTSSPAILIAWLDTAAYRISTDDPTAMSFTPTLVPFKNPYQSNTGTIDVKSLSTGSALGLFVALGFSVIPAIAVTAIVEERETSVLHQQLLSGASVAGYWLSNFLYDLLIFVPVLFAAVGVILVLGLPGLSNDYLFVVVLMMFLFAVQVLPLAYIISHLFSSSVTAMNMTRAVFSITGFIFTSVGNLIAVIVHDNPTLIDIIQVLFGAVPNAGLAQGLGKLTLMGGVCEMEKKASGGPCTQNPWNLDNGVGLYILSSFFYAILWGIIVVYIEKKRLQPPKFTLNNCTMDTKEDIDVVNERQNAAVAEHPVVSTDRLRKVYKASGLTPETVAVHDLSLAIERGTCFGLLGPNGAGKTTAMSMLTGTAWATQGTASIASHGIHDDIHSIYKKLGFCPQFHGLFPAMTVDEHLIFYGELKGMSMPAIQAFIRVLTNSLDMEEHRNKLSKHLSGGNKRKLSLALSMMGAPDVMILDEPSAGIDPNARQNMVNIIKGERANRCIILTTHLMEECEALCNRIGIMVNGKLVAIGSLQHLKSRHGNFWQIDVTLKDAAPKQAHQDLTALMKSLDEGCLVIESHLNSSVWNVPNNGGLKLADCFRLFETNKERLHIQQYSVTQCSLEQIFIKFARSQLSEVKS